MSRILAMTRARLRELTRDRTQMAWQLLCMPLLIIVVVVVLSGAPRPVFTVAVLGDLPLTPQSHSFLGTEATRFYREKDESAAMIALRRQSTDLLLDLRERPAHYVINNESAKGRLLQSILAAKDPAARARSVSGKSVRYTDWLVPGLLGFNIMFSSLMGIGHVIVRYRRTGFLKRLHGTPLRSLEFVGAQLLASLLMTVTTSAVVFLVCTKLLHVRMEGSYFNLLLVTVFGSMAMIAMSLPMAARTTSEQLSTSLVNLLAWPMVSLSGMFFSLDGAPAALQTLAQVFPLTHLLSAARAVMFDGAGLADLARPLLLMAGLTAAFLAVGASLFRWAED